MSKQVILRIGGTGQRRFIYLSNMEDIRFFIESYSPTVDFFIGDLSQMTSSAISLFLKFLEEDVTGKIECYASRDNINPVIVSRFTQVIKNQKFLVGKEEFGDYIRSMEQGEQVTPESFLSIAGGNLIPYMIYTRMSRGLKTRVGDLL